MLVPTSLPNRAHCSTKSTNQSFYLLPFVHYIQPIVYSRIIIYYSVLFIFDIPQTTWSITPLLQISIQDQYEAVLIIDTHSVYESRVYCILASLQTRGPQAVKDLLVSEK